LAAIPAGYFKREKKKQEKRVEFLFFAKKIKKLISL
jgi:hypothetical protein